MKIRELREALGLSQKDLAIKAGVAQSTIHYVENGRNSEYRTMKKIANALGVPVSSLDDDHSKAAS